MQICYNLHKLEGALVFQITEQSKSLTEYVQDNDKFVASNGWTVTSSNYPEIDIESKTISIRGMGKYLDLQPDFVFGMANSERDRLSTKIVTAIEELLDEAIGEDNQLEYPVFSKSTRKSNSRVQIISV